MMPLAGAEELIRFRASIIAPQSPLIMALDVFHFRKVNELPLAWRLFKSIRIKLIPLRSPFSC